MKSMTKSASKSGGVVSPSGPVALDDVALGEVAGGIVRRISAAPWWAGFGVANGYVPVYVPPR